MTEREQCDKYTDGLREATGEDVEVNSSEDQMDRMKALKENMTLFNWMKIEEKNFLYFLYVPNLLVFDYNSPYFPSL